MLHDYDYQKGGTNEVYPGPWGHIEFVTTMIAPPASIMGDDATSDKSMAWQFSGITSNALDKLLRDAGLDQKSVETLMAHTEPATNGADIVIDPPDSIRLGMDDPTRARVYALMRDSTINKFYKYPFQIDPLFTDDWFRDASLSDATHELLDRLVYRYDSMTYFSDVRFVLSKIGSATERRDFFSALLRQTTLLACLRIDSKKEVDSLTAYWGSHRRESKVRPILEAAARSGTSWPVSLNLLLPSLPREKLFTYNDRRGGSFYDCNWTALNFFNDPPDDRFLKAEFVTNTIFDRYTPVTSDFLPGDVILLRNKDDKIVHMCNYIADNIVFTKNGGDVAQPWILTTLKGVVDYYSIGGDVPNVLFLREKE